MSETDPRDLKADHQPEELTPMSGFLVFLKDMRFTGSWDLPTLDRAIEVGETIASQSLGRAESELSRIREVDPVSHIDILREWFGGDRYARDYEYLDANFGKQAKQVSTYLAGRASQPYSGEVGEALARQIRQIVDDALNSAIPESWEVADHATKRILAAVSVPAEEMRVSK